MKSILMISLLSSMAFTSASEAATRKIYIQCEADGPIAEGFISLPTKPNTECVMSNYIIYAKSTQRISVSYGDKTYVSAEDSKFYFKKPGCKMEDLSSVHYPSGLRESRSGFPISFSIPIPSDKTSKRIFGYVGIGPNYFGRTCVFQTAD